MFCCNSTNTVRGADELETVVTLSGNKFGNSSNSESSAFKLFQVGIPGAIPSKQKCSGFRSHTLCCHFMNPILHHSLPLDLNEINTRTGTVRAREFGQLSGNTLQHFLQFVQGRVQEYPENQPRFVLLLNKPKQVR